MEVLEAGERAGDFKIGGFVEDGAARDSTGTHVIADDRDGVDIWVVVEDFAVCGFLAVDENFGFAKDSWDRIMENRGLIP